MKQKFTKEELEEIERQLSCPSGLTGLDVAREMHKSNIGMTRSALEVLDLQSGQQVLELGHGNASHLDDLLSLATDLKYTGLELSSTMFEEAKAHHQKHIVAKNATFHLYDGDTIPFDSAQFDRIFTVNTIYFWQKPAALLQELARVLQPKGRCVIAFAHQDAMQHFPFVKTKFQLYDEAKLEALVAATDFKLVELAHRVDQVELEEDQWMDRQYCLAILEKS